MSLESAKEFVERMNNDEDFAKEVVSCKDAEMRKAFVKKAGFDFTLEELKAYRSELTDEQLESLKGGAFSFCPMDLCKCITSNMVEVAY